MQPFAFTCPCCGRQVVDLPELGYDAPVYYAAIPEAERPQRATLTSDLCTIDDEDFFIRAVCRVPIKERARDYGWGIWVSLSRENFKRYRDSYDAPDQSKIGPMFGWFSNALPDYPDTTKLQTTVVPQDGNQRPLVYINDANADHPLYVEQHEGISETRLAQIYARNLCPG
jgi:hypothetical protein